MTSNQIFIRKRTDSSLDEWRTAEKMALELLQVVGELRFDRSIDLILFTRDIYDCRPSKVLNDHLFSENYSGERLKISDSLLLAKGIATFRDLAPCKIDLGSLGIKWQNGANGDLKGFLEIELKDFIGVSPINGWHKDVVLYGFGRIGRLLARQIVSSTGSGEQLRLKAIVIRPKLKNRVEEATKRAALLLSDSVHGDFHGSVELNADGSEMIINGNRVQLIFANHPYELDYTLFGIENALVIDNTGVWREREGLSQHLRPGVSHVMLTAPGTGDVPNIVYGANEESFDFSKESILSAASCTTNAIVPVLGLIHDMYEIVKGHIETIHSYTNDQNLLDNFHKKPRRGRGAPVNMVLTTTEAAKAVAEIYPSLEEKITGNAIRVPTPNVSLAILYLTLKKKTSVKELNQEFREASLHGNLAEQIHYSTSTEYVSSNAIGMTSTSVVDAPSTRVSEDGQSAIVYLWYDNEFGYSCQVVRLAKHVAGVRRYHYR